MNQLAQARNRAADVIFFILISTKVNQKKTEAFRIVLYALFLACASWFKTKYVLG